MGRGERPLWRGSGILRHRPLDPLYAGSVTLETALNEIGVMRPGTEVKSRSRPERALVQRGVRHVNPRRHRDQVACPYCEPRCA